MNLLSKDSVSENVCNRAKAPKTHKTHLRLLKSKLLSSTHLSPGKKRILHKFTGLNNNTTTHFAFLFLSHSFTLIFLLGRKSPLSEFIQSAVEPTSK